jgi:hypothetical protein
MFRLHIDIPLSHDQLESISLTKEFIYRLHDMLDLDSDREKALVSKIRKIQYRLGNDEDRQNSNYLDINENGHVSTKKCKIVLNEE